MYVLGGGGGVLLKISKIALRTTTKWSKWSSGQNEERQKDILIFIVDWNEAIKLN